MRVVLSVPGVFHHFALARELAQRGHLARINTTFPWARVRREGVARSLVRTFPLISPLAIAVHRKLHPPESFRRWMDTANARSFDTFAATTLPPCDVVIALSGSGLKTGRAAQARGATYICDRGSSHIRFQDEIIREEYARWGCTTEASVSPAIAREEAEYAAADYIVVPSEFSYRSFVQMGVPASKLVKAVLAADISRFYPVGTPDEDEFTVLYVGQISFRKGLPYLIEAFSKLRHPRKRLRLIGAIEQQIRPYLQTAPLDHVVFEGSKGVDEIRMAMSSSHVLVLPSIEDGFGMVMAEAMACGSPIISSLHTGGLDLFDDGKEGFHVPIRNPLALCTALQRLADNPALRKEMSAAALDKMQKLGGWKQYGNVVEDFLLQLKVLSQRAVHA